MEELKKNLNILVCPRCGGELGLKENYLFCERCNLKYPIVDGIPQLVVSVNEVWRSGEKG
ncbi:Trm112 family protein [Thermococcus sp. M39]|uniref:Trm112 family protein n=1 Tax=unclassified Thermococcus TaxID=2627626 RepID=UPI00143B1F0F|nr:Trm112 family protein [Thermococcus sp. M39]NJE11826.1 Trm112 family protein [Thermococcus sp. LS2]